jgi:hypothetical protein
VATKRYRYQHRLGYLTVNGDDLGWRYIYDGFARARHPSVGAPSRTLDYQTPERQLGRKGEACGATAAKGLAT